MQTELWTYQTPCSYSNLICFSQVLYKKCYYYHSEQNKRQMEIRWGDLKHNLRREMEQTWQQTQPTCESGINCYYLLTGKCRNQHSTFDLTFAYNIRKRLFQIECPKAECPVTSCVYHHSDRDNQLFEEIKKKLKKLYKQAKQRQLTLQEPQSLQNEEVNTQE